MKVKPRARLSIVRVVRLAASTVPWAHTPCPTQRTTGFFPSAGRHAVDGEGVTTAPDIAAS